MITYLYDQILIFFLNNGKTQISHSKWPSTQHAPKVAEQLGVMYKNWSMNYAAYVVTELNSKEIEGAEENIQQILNYVNENLLKVTSLNIDFFDNVIKS